MRHRKGFNHLSRKAPHRKAMLANMAASLIMEKRITTTTAKAKALRSYVEPLITKSKNDTTHSRRVVFSYLQDKDAVSELFREVSPKIMERAGGYTRILKLDQNRLGDNAEMAMIELVDFNPNLLTETKEKTGGGTRRRRRGGSKKKSASEAPADKSGAVKEDTASAEEAGEAQKGEDNQQKTEEQSQVEAGKESSGVNDQADAEKQSPEEKENGIKAETSSETGEETPENKTGEEDKNDNSEDDKKES